MASLITTVRNRFLDAIRSVNPPGRWKVLVVDEHAQKLLGSTLKQYDILEENVTLIESINNNRSPQQFEALYLLMPTTQNVDRIIADFSNGRQQYLGAHVFFVEGLPENLVDRLVSSSVEPYLKALKELYLNFWPIESQAFSLNTPAMFYSLFSPPRSPTAVRGARLRAEEDLRFVARCILNICVSLEEYPLVRYYLPSHQKPLGPFNLPPESRVPPTEGSGRWRTNLARGDAARAEADADSTYLTKILAHMVQEELDEYKKATPDFPKSEGARPRGVLFITDRTMDTFAPFLHEFTYQAMCNDLLPIDNGTKYRYKFQTALGEFEDKVATLSDADSVWTDVRHMHMREAIDKLMADFNQFMQENAGFKGDGVASLNDMKDMLAGLPQYQEMREKFSLHLNMAQECMSIFEQQKLPAAASVEQNCATGTTAEGKAPKHLVEEMVPLLDSNEIGNASKVRIIALYIQFREGVPDEDRRRLFQHARLSRSEQDAVNNLVHLGARVTRLPGDKDVRKRLKQKPGTDDYELSRYKPAIRTMLEDHVGSKLDPTMFPYVRDAPTATSSAASLRTTASPTPAGSLRSAKPSWHRVPQRGATAEIRQRLIVFVAGGMTYSEMRTAYQLSSSLGKDISIGSTHVLYPEAFMDELKVLELGGVGSRALPNGLREASGESRPYQSYYDQKYYTKDAPAPVPAPAPAPAAAQRSNKLRPGPSPMPSPAGSAMSLGSIGEPQKEKKKKGLFRF
ncbi:Sec1-like snare protein [Ramaria rubella]|nr:Sec1-like snare protein [Ramaria rubella]